jgi:hypothetical protein
LHAGIIRYNAKMPRISSHERASVQKRIALVEDLLRELHGVIDLSPRQKLGRWQSLYAKLKSLRQSTTPVRFITRWNARAQARPA